MTVAVPVTTTIISMIVLLLTMPYLDHPWLFDSGSDPSMACLKQNHYVAIEYNVVHKVFLEIDVDQNLLHRGVCIGPADCNHCNCNRKMFQHLHQHAFNFTRFD